MPIGTGMLVAPDDPPALAESLRWLINERDERRRLAANARAAAIKLPTWPASARLFASAIATINASAAIMISVGVAILTIWTRATTSLWSIAGWRATGSPAPR